jgi:hypothetical protein
VVSRNRQNITGSGTPEKSHSAYPCEVAGGSSLAEPWDDSSAAEALGFLTAGAWRAGRALRAAASVLVEATYAVIAPRKARGNRGPETERSPVGVAVVSPVSASRSLSAFRPRLSRVLTGASTASRRRGAHSICAGGR